MPADRGKTKNGRNKPKKGKKRVYTQKRTGVRLYPGADKTHCQPRPWTFAATLEAPPEVPSIGATLHDATAGRPSSFVYRLFFAPATPVRSQLRCEFALFGIVAAVSRNAAAAMEETG